MKRYLLLITLSSFSLLSCQKNDGITDTEYHADKNIAGEYKGFFSWTKDNSESALRAGAENQEGTFSIIYINERKLQITSNIASDVKYKIYELTLSEIKQVDNHVEYYFTGMAKDYTEKISSFAQMSLITSIDKNEFSFYGSNSFDGVNGETLRITEAVSNR